MSSSLVQLGPDAAATAVLAGTVVFVIGAVGLSRSFFRRHLGQRLSGDALEIASVLGAKVASGLLFGFAGLLVLEATLPDAGALGWSLRWTGRALLVLAAAATICLAMVVRAARAPAMRERYPEARVSRWSVSAHALDAIGWIVFGLHHPLSHRSGGLDIGDVVERDQCVQRRVGERRLDRTGLPRGDIKKHRRPNDPPPKNVEATAIELGSFVADVRFFAEGRLLPNAIGLIGLYGGAAERITQ